MLKKMKTKQFGEGIKEMYYICPDCGALSTLSSQLEDFDIGGLPYCYCKYNSCLRILIEYKRIQKKLYDKLKQIKSNKNRLAIYLVIKKCQ
jgi:hypothetical protein